MKELKYRFRKLNNRNWVVSRLPSREFAFPSELSSRTKAERKFLTELHHWLEGETDFIIIAIKNSHTHNVEGG